MANTLNWADDDDEDAVRALEEAFEIGFSGVELAQVTTVGALHDLVMQKLPRGNERGKCASAMAFYRLRAALRAGTGVPRILPSTALASLPIRSPRQLLQDLERQTGLRLGAAPYTWMGKSGWILIVGALLAILVPGLWRQYLRAIAATLFLGVVLINTDPRRLTGTVGDLARKAARRNMGRLIKQGAQGRDQDIWDVLSEILSANSKLKPEEITRETVFFRSQLKPA